MLRVICVPTLTLLCMAFPAAAQTTDPRTPPRALKPQDSAASTDAKKPKPRATAPQTVTAQYIASLRNQIEKLLMQIVDVDKQITDLKNFSAGPSTNASGVDLDKRLERAPLEVRIRALRDKKKDLQSKVDALYDEARKKGVESGQLP